MACLILGKQHFYFSVGCHIHFAENQQPTFAMRVKDKEFTVFIDREKLQQRVQDLGQQITQDHKGQVPVLVCVLNGAYMFFSDLTKSIDLQIEVSFTRYASYHSDTQSSGEVRKLIGFEAENIAGRDVIIVEDIIDTGLTMNKLLADVSAFGPKSVKVASLLFKPDALQHKTQIDYLGFEIADKFVVGYGLDYDGEGRNLCDLYQLIE